MSESVTLDPTTEIVMKHPPIIWTKLSQAEKLVWASAFASNGSEDAQESAQIADSTVYRLRTLTDRECVPVRSPESEAAYANVNLDRTTFDTWYRVQMQIVFGNRPNFHVPRDEECADAFKRYAMGRDAYY